jgi:hypothetical protein
LNKDDPSNYTPESNYNAWCNCQNSNCKCKMRQCKIKYRSNFKLNNDPGSKESAVDATNLHLVAGCPCHKGRLCPHNNLVTTHPELCKQ